MRNRVRINLHDFDEDSESILKGFKEAAESQEWPEDEINEVLDDLKDCNFDELMNRIEEYTEPDYYYDENEFGDYDMGDDDYDDRDDYYHELDYPEYTYEED